MLWHWTCVKGEAQVHTQYSRWFHCYTTIWRCISMNPQALAPRHLQVRDACGHQRVQVLHSSRELHTRHYRDHKQNTIWLSTLFCLTTDKRRSGCSTSSSSSGQRRTRSALKWHTHLSTTASQATTEQRLTRLQWCEIQWNVGISGQVLDKSIFLVESGLTFAWFCILIFGLLIFGFTGLELYHFHSISFRCRKWKWCTKTLSWFACMFDHTSNLSHFSKLVYPSVPVTLWVSAVRTTNHIYSKLSLSWSACWP